MAYTYNNIDNNLMLMSELYSGKAYACIKMLKILNSGRLYSVSELADLIGTKARNIIEYKKELESIGYEIDTVSGRNGGYRMNVAANIPSIKLSLAEKEVMSEAYDYLIAKKDFLKKKEFVSAFSNIMSQVDISEQKDRLFVVDKYQLQMSQDELRKRYCFIEDAINAKRTIEILYGSLINGLKKHVIDPYKLFIYNNSWFFLGWDHDKADVLYFKLNRINEYSMKDEEFKVWKYFKPENYFDDVGLINNGKYHHLVMIVSGTRARLMKERVYGKNQVIEELGDGTYRVSLDMQNDNTLVSFVLSCGSEAKLLEPQWLVDKVKEEINSIRKNYED